MKKFTSPNKAYNPKYFKTTRTPKSPSPKRKDYGSRAQTKDDGKSRCTYIHPETNKRCRNKLGLYPTFCKLHTMVIENVFIAPSQIKGAGNGLFAGPYGFKRGEIIGEYSKPWNALSKGTLEKRCKEDDKCYSYSFCDTGSAKNTKCWDGLDLRSTIMRNINDAHKSKFRNNSFFDIIRGHVYVIASKNIKPKTEIFVTYGNEYWN